MVNSRVNCTSCHIKSDKRKQGFAGHFSRRLEEPVLKLIHRIPKHEGDHMGDQPYNIIDVLRQDTGLEAPEMKPAMKNMH